MTQPTKQDREAARAIKIGICACSGQPEYTCIKHEAIATALANERARGWDEAKAEAAEIARQFQRDFIKNRSSFGDDAQLQIIAFAQVADQIANAILAPASGPTVEQQVRAEIAEAVKAMPQRHFAYSEHGTYVRFSDVLAIIERGEK